MQNLYLETERLLLTTADRTMAKNILDFYICNAEHLKMWEDAKDDDFYTAEYQRSLIKYEQRCVRQGTGIDFWIFEKYGGHLAGKIAVFSLSGGNYANCMVGYKLDKNCQSRGYMHEAMTRVIDFLFHEMNLHRIEICIVPRNIRSVNVAEKLGFKRECISEKLMRINGVWEDHARYVLINDEYAEI